MSKNIQLENLVKKDFSEIKYKELISISNLNDEESLKIYEYFTKFSPVQISEIISKLVHMNDEESYK